MLVRQIPFLSFIVLFFKLKKDLVNVGLFIIIIGDLISIIASICLLLSEYILILALIFSIYLVLLSKIVISFVTLGFGELLVEVVFVLSLVKMDYLSG